MMAKNSLYTKELFRKDILYTENIMICVMNPIQNHLDALKLREELNGIKGEIEDIKNEVNKLRIRHEKIKEIEEKEKALAEKKNICRFTRSISTPDFDTFDDAKGKTRVKKTRRRSNKPVVEVDDVCPIKVMLPKSERKGILKRAMSFRKNTDLVQKAEKKEIKEEIKNEIEEVLPR